MSQTIEFEIAMQDAWSALIAMRRKWNGIGSAFLCLVIVYPLASWLFKLETSLLGWAVILIIAIAGKYFAYHQLKLAEEKYFGEFPALIPEEE